MVELIRVSYGTAIVLGLIKAKLLAKPTTAYLMTYWPGRCSNDCAFCAQARSSRADLEKLSRVVWPAFKVKDVVEHLRNSGFTRVCLQTIEYPKMLDDVFELLERFSPLKLPISVSITPVDSETLEGFKSLGVDYVGVGLDVASERIFRDIKPDASWNELWDFAERVVNVFGHGKAVIHIIVGLGESDRDLIDVFIRAREVGADVSLFAFTPIKGTRLETLNPPSIERYRKIQLARYLVSIEKGDAIVFKEDSIEGFALSEEELSKIPPTVFMTHGCPGCNRPYYNERPGKEPYNYPFPPKRDEVIKAIRLIL
jgi:biotin synthase-related radical SAM superfamily protein